MTNAKSEVEALMRKLPDDCSLEDIQYHLYVVEKIKRGIERAEQEGAVPHDIVKTVYLNKWEREL